MEYEYIVYKTTNKINGKYYVGVHKTIKGTIDKYIGNGTTCEKYNAKYAFHCAVKKYGYKNFVRETLFTYPGTEEGKIEAYKKEAEIVNRDFIKDPMTYNECLGGRVPSSVHERAVCQYDLDGNFIKLWNSMSEAKEVAPSQSISDCCIRKTASNYFQWRYYEGNTDNIEPCETKRKKVYQFDLQGNYIRYYRSLHDASRDTNIPFQSIGGNCLGKQSSAGGYYWSYKKHFDYDPSKQRKTAVACYNDNGEFIRSFDTVKEAAEFVGVGHSNISECIRGRRKHCKKLRWRYFYGNTSNISSL